MLNGCHYDYIDFSITVGSEAGTAASQKGIRVWMQLLSEFMGSYDFVHSRLAPEWIEAYPQHLTLSALSSQGSDYAAYLADSREVGDGSAGESVSGNVALNLPAGIYDVRLYSPVTGEYSPAIEVKGGARQSLALPSFHQDIVIRATRRMQ